MKHLDILLLLCLALLWACAKLHFFARYGATTVDGYIEEHWPLWAGMVAVTLLVVLVRLGRKRSER
jgi:hypothetical protein